MRCVVEPIRSLPWSRLALFSGIALAAVSCSSESSRFNENPFNPSPRMSSRQASPGDVTGSVSSRPASKPSSISSQPLPPPPVASSQIQTRPAVSSTPTSGGSRGLASYNPSTHQPDVTGSVQQPVAAPAQRNWSWDGGTAVTVAQGETAHILAQRYGVPVSAIVQANNLPDAAAVKPGQRLIIPRYEATGSAPPRPAAAQPVPAKPAPQIAAPQTTSGTYVHTIAPGETLMKLSRQYKKTLSEIARANNLAPHTQVKVGDRIVIPGLRGQPQQQLAAATTAPAIQQPRPAQQPQQLAQQPAWPPAPQTVASREPASTARVVSPATENPVVEKTKAETTSSLPGFRWPVRGRVVTAFGPRPSGQQNDGINVAVPEGTPVKAAEDGVVAYAGNELKTYGNLVLIRHSNGYVTAYAHASEILVKRDEPIKRGQVIAKSGQTGNVSAPQLHFEIRKGSSPVDPMPYLDKGGNT